VGLSDPPLNLVLRTRKFQAPSTNNQIIIKFKAPNSKRFGFGILDLFGDCDFGFVISSPGGRVLVVAAELIG
jgi:hypothetical protein